MNEDEYQLRAKRIKRRNHIWFGAIMGGLVALVVGAKAYTSNPNIPYEQRKSLYDRVCFIPGLAAGAVSYFFTVKETEQLRRLEERYQGESDSYKR